MELENNTVITKSPSVININHQFAQSLEPNFSTEIMRVSDNENKYIELKGKIRKNTVRIMCLSSLMMFSLLFEFFLIHFHYAQALKFNNPLGILFLLGYFFSMIVNVGLIIQSAYIIYLIAYYNKLKSILFVN